MLRRGMPEGNNLPDAYKKRQMSFSNPRTSKMRTILAATLIVGLVVLFICNSDSSFAHSIRSMASNTPQEARDPHVTKAQLTLELKESEGKTSPPTIVATVTNHHESTAVTLLTWDTPFDDKALLLGLIQIKNVETGRVLPPAGIKINRQLPPPDDAFLEIGPRRAIAKEIVLQGPGARLQKGAKYEVQMKGKWKAVWQASVADIGYANLQKMGGGTGVLSFDFDSNAVEITA